MDDVVKKVRIDAQIEAVWQALTDAGTIAEWMLDPSAALDLRAGGEYWLFGGETSGQFTVIEKPRLLEYSWRQSAWPSEWADSRVRWELVAEGGATQVMLTHSQFPNDDERAGHDSGWDDYWLEPMIDYLERGS